MTLFSVLVDVYHKEKLVTKEEAKMVAFTECMVGLDWQRWWADVAVTKDVVTAARIADILDEHGFNNVAQRIRGKCVYSCLYVYVNTVYWILDTGYAVTVVSSEVHRSACSSYTPLSVCAVRMY